MPEALEATSSGGQVPDAPVSINQAIHHISEFGPGQRRIFLLVRSALRLAIGRTCASVGSTGCAAPPKPAPSRTR